MMAQTGGQFPSSKEEIDALEASIRRQARLVEGNIGLTNSWNPRHHSESYFGSYEDENASDRSTEWPSCHAGHNAETTQVYLEDGWPTCKECGAFFYEDGVDDVDDTDSEEEIGTDMDSEEWNDFVGLAEGENYETLTADYMYAKRRFRAFQGKAPRRTRFPRRAKLNWRRPKEKEDLEATKEKGSGKIHGETFSSTAVPSIGSSSLAGGKGKSS